MTSKVWHEITWPFPNRCTTEVCEWISYFIPHFMMNVITYPCWNLSKSMLVNGTQYHIFLKASEQQVTTYMICIVEFAIKLIGPWGIWPQSQISKFQTHFSNKYLKYYLWNCYRVNATTPHWSLVNIGSGNGLVPSGNKPLPEPMLT